MLACDLDALASPKLDKLLPWVVAVLLCEPALCCGPNALCNVAGTLSLQSKQVMPYGKWHAVGASLGCRGWSILLATQLMVRFKQEIKWMNKIIPLQLGWRIWQEVKLFLSKQ